MTLRRRRRTKSRDFRRYLDGIPALIQWPATRSDDALARTARNSGIAGLSDSALYPGVNLLTNGTFTAWTADDPDDWTVSEVGDATSNITQNPTGQCQIISSGVTNVFMTQSILSADKKYRADMEMTASVSGSLVWGAIGGSTSTITGTGDKSLAFASGADARFIIGRNTAGDRTIDNVVVKEINPLDGIITGATVNKPATGWLAGGDSIDGINDYINIYSAALAGVFDSDNGGLYAFGLSDTWAAGVDILMRLAADANNEVVLSRSGTDLILTYGAGGTAESVTIASGSPDGWWSVMLTWDTSGGGAVKAYYNGKQSGTTQTIAGLWAGTLAATLCCIGAGATTPANVWAGDVAECGLFVGVTPSDALVAEIHQRSGI